MPAHREIAFDVTGYPDVPGFGTAVARAILVRVSRGEVGETFRLNVPPRIVAFGKLDRHSPGYDEALAAAATHGYAAVERLAGGRAAVFHERTLAFSWTIPDPSPRIGIRARFEAAAGLMVRAMHRIGVDAAVGEVPGEYCPGEYSVHVGGRRKVMGIGQRLTRRAAHIGGVVVVDDASAVREVLIPVYEALELAWDPATAGAVTDAAPGITPAAMAAAITAELEVLASVIPTEPEHETLQLAARLLPEHLPARVGRPESAR
jgi:lipoate-protein ligase A